MASVTINQKKNKAGTYQVEIVITASSSDLTNYTVTVDLPTGSVMTTAKHFTVSGSVLTPDSKNSTIKAGKSVTTKVQGTGTTPTQAWISGSGPTPGPSGPSGHTGPPAPTGDTGTPGPSGSVTYLVNLPMTNTTMAEVSAAGSGTKWQYSYPANVGFSATEPNPKYFKIGDQGLEVNIYVGDKAFMAGNTTEPRSELRNMAVILDKVAYTLEFERYTNVAPTFDCGLMQIFGNSFPNIILRWRSGSYEILSDAGVHASYKFPGSLADDVGTWAHWKFEFLLDTTAGHERLYRNGVKLVDVEGINNSGGNNSYLKMGCYAQQMKPQNDVTTYLKNVMLYY